MGQSHSEGTYFREARIKDQFVSVQTLWNEEDLASLVSRLKDMTLNFSLDRMKFAKLLQLAASYEDLVAQWFRDFSQDRASQVADGLELLSACIMVSSKVGLSRKIRLLFELFDLDKTGCVRKDEFTIFLKAAMAGLYRVVYGLPPPASVVELGAISAEFFGTISNQVLTQQLFFSWVTEAHYSLHYLSTLSKLGKAVFVWGSNQRRQLGLDFEPAVQAVPAPLLPLEGVNIAAVATNESHSIFLSAEGQVYTCGLGFCGILGHGNTLDSAQPRLIESLAHTRITCVAVGVRHSVAVSEKGQVFTWGAADVGQLGHGSLADREVHEWAFDPKTGGQFAYVPKPTVVMGLFGRRICAKKASCCSFSTAVLTDQGLLYSWGNNTDGQCGQGQKCADHTLTYVDPHMHRTAMQAILLPRKLELDVSFRALVCGGYHMLAIDHQSQLWSWGQGMWGKLGHGDQRSMHEPKLVHSLRYQICLDMAAGEAHSLCLCGLYRITVTGASSMQPLSPFSLLGLPIGRADRDVAARQPLTPSGSQLQFNAFACAPLLQVSLPLPFNPDVPIPPPVAGTFPGSVLLMDRGLWEGEWLKLSTTDFDFRVAMSPAGAQLSVRSALPGQLLFASEGRWEPEDCADRICVFDELTSRSNALQEQLATAVLELAQRCQEGRGLACLLVLPQGQPLFPVRSLGANLRGFPFGVLSYEHGMALRQHVTRLINTRLNSSPDSVPDHLHGWRECQEEWTGKTYYEHVRSGAKRRAPPQVYPDTRASLLAVREDSFLPRLNAVLGLRPKGIIICQQSWRPDVELLDLPETMLQDLRIPMVMVTFEAGEELKSVEQTGCSPWASMELQAYGGVFAWGNCTLGQLGLAGIENQDFLTHAQNALTGEESTFASAPRYVAHLHEHQVISLSCGADHSVAVTQQGEAFTWGAAEGLGVQVDRHMNDVPVFVEQLEGLVKCSKAFAGHKQSFVLAQMPFESVV